MQRGLIGLLRSANSSLAHQGLSSLRIETPPGVHLWDFDGVFKN